MARVILHLDLDAFFCAVEEQRDPSLVGKPFAVGGQPDQRGVVASCSYPARVFGVRSAMPMAQALRRCPDLIIISQHFGDYRHYSREVMKRLNNLTPLVEQISIDEAFLDVTGIRGTPAEIASRVQALINEELNLPCSLGVATNKLVAKIANNIGKAELRSNRPPNAIKVVPPGEEAGFLAPLPISELWGVGPKTAERMKIMGIKTIGDIAAWPPADMQRRFGKLGADIARRARGQDNRPVEPEHDTKSISKETTFSTDKNDRDVLVATLRRLSDGVGRRLRRDELAGRTVTIKLRWSDFTTITRQTTLDRPIHTDEEIFDVAVSVFDDAWPKGRAVRLIGVGISGFDAQPHQLSLFDQPKPPTDDRLQSALDQLRDRFGDSAVKRGSDLQNNQE